MICSDDGSFTCTEPTIEDLIAEIVEEMTPTTEAPVKEPTASPSAAPVPPTATPTMDPTASPTPAPFLTGRMDICAENNERAVTCGAESSDRPHLCCAGFVCSDNAQGKKYACVPAPTPFPTPFPTASPTTAAPVVPTEPPVVPIIENKDDETEETPVTVPVPETSDASATCGIEIDTKCFVHEPHQTEAIDCREVTGTAHSSGELLDVTWSYTLTNTCEDNWTVIARQNVRSCKLCRGESGLQCEKEINFFQPTEDNCAVLDNTGRFLGFPPGCSITESELNEIKVGNDDTGRCIYNKDVNLRVIEGVSTKPVVLKYSFVAPKPFGDSPP